MTLLTCTTHMFVFVFLNAMDLSKARCLDHLVKAEEKGENLTVIYTLVRTEDLKGTVECTLDAECNGGRQAACDIIDDCKINFNFKKNSPKCKGKSSEKIFFYHFMCFMYEALDNPHPACAYDTVCKMYSEKTSTHYSLTTTPPPTTTLPETTTATTTLPETTATTTSLPSSTKAGIAMEPTTILAETAVLPSTPPPTTAAITIAKMETTATTLADGERKDQINGGTPKNATADNRTYFLVLSLLFNVILPPAVYLYMRHQQDRRQWTSTHLSNGNLTDEQPKTESDAYTNKDAENELLPQTDTHSDDSIINLEEQTDLQLTTFALKVWM